MLYLSSFLKPILILRIKPSSMSAILIRDSDMGTIRCTKNPINIFVWWSLFSIFCSVFVSTSYAANNTITLGQEIRDGQTIISENQIFEFGFFSPVNSTNRYVGIWYYRIPGQNVIWVANRETPISGENGVLTIGNDGNLVVSDGNGGGPVWSTNRSNVSSNNSTATLLNTGNLILSSGDNTAGDLDRALWQSFNDPTDTFLPNMRAYMNVQSGENRTFTSWKSENDPSPGRYSMGVDPRGSPQIVIWDGPNRRWRTGHWNGQFFTGIPDIRTVFLYGFGLNRDGDGDRYFEYFPSNSSEILRFRINPNGTEEQLRWDEVTRVWSVMQSLPSNPCDFYNSCGNFGKCAVVDSGPMCSCIEGYVPKDLDQWNRGNWSGSGGCRRRTQLQCERNNGKRDGFLKVKWVKLPDFLDYVGTEDIEQCEERCLSNCSCKAFAFVSGINCMLWNGDLVDIQQFEQGGNTLHVRVANSELGGKRKISTPAIIGIVVGVAFFLSVSIWLLWRFRGKLKGGTNSSGKNNNTLPIYDPHRSEEISTDLSRQDDYSGEGHQSTGPELLMLSFNCIAEATNDFSLQNKLGEGGFGPVYKGTLPGGQEIAVKRLSRRSGQGLEEFKNEIALIAKLQHRNLVRLLGCCIQGEEKILIYEYMPNKSLDSSLFDPAKQAQLDWRKRFVIIEGIARGLLYLHRDSRLTIIHRDLKASNILLDDEMNPKISDFGMARIFGGNQNEANTNRVVGTYGYMAPEYAMEGFFSGKSDVYSFGVLLLEIVSGKRNSSFRSPEYTNIVGYAWNLWDGGRAMELVDPSIAGSDCQNEVLRCIQVGMLCVQDMAVHRPSMSHVVLMLESESATLPMPKQPTFTSMRNSVDLDAWRENLDIISSNDVTVSEVVGR